MTDIKAELWGLAVIVAMTRLGILPMLHDGNGAWVAPSADVAADPEGTRKARRKYRKLWRRSIARDLRWFDLLPKRQQRKHKWTGAYVKGKWRSHEDPLEGQLLKILSCDVGSRPNRHARGERWDMVKHSVELRETLLQVAYEFGLLDPKPSM